MSEATRKKSPSEKTFKAIKEFVQVLADSFARRNRPLKLYCHLLNRTESYRNHRKAAKKHIEAFAAFCKNNNEAIVSKDIDRCVQRRVSYSKQVYIDFKDVFGDADSEVRSVIWQHLLYISVRTNPEAGEAKEILQNPSTEDDFVSSIRDRIQESVDVDDLSNPMQAVSSIMQSGLLKDLMGTMGGGVENGTFDFKKLMGSVRTMVTSLNEDAGGGGQGEQGMQMINTMMDSVDNLVSNLDNVESTTGEAPAMPDLAGMLGPMMGMMTNIGPSMSNTIEEIE